MNRFRPNLAVLAIMLLAVLSACASNGATGYAETQLDRNVFRVSYQGNVLSSQGDADDRVLLRSAEVARAHGFAYFVSSGFARTGSALAVPGTSVSVPASTLTIAGYVARPEVAVVYDVDEVMARLGPRYPR